MVRALRGTAHGTGPRAAGSNSAGTETGLQMKSHRGKWKRRRPHTIPVMHRTLHRVDMDRELRHHGSARVLGWLAVTGLVFLACTSLLLILCHLRFDCKAPARNSAVHFNHWP